MEIKYLVICVQDGGDVQSVTPFDSYDDANTFLAEAAKRMYDKIADNYVSDIDVYSGGAEVVDGEETYSWSIYPLTLNNSEELK